MIGTSNGAATASIDELVRELYERTVKARPRDTAPATQSPTPTATQTPTDAGSTGVTNWTSLSGQHVCPPGGAPYLTDYWPIDFTTQLMGVTAIATPAIVRDIAVRNPRLLQQLTDVLQTGGEVLLGEAGGNFGGAVGGLIESIVDGIGDLIGGFVRDFQPQLRDLVLTVPRDAAEARARSWSLFSQLLNHLLDGLPNMLHVIGKGTRGGPPSLADPTVAAALVVPMLTHLTPGLLAVLANAVTANGPRPAAA